MRAERWCPTPAPASPCPAPRPPRRRCWSLRHARRVGHQRRERRAMPAVQAQRAVGEFIMLFCASSVAPAWRSACTMAASRRAGGSPASTREPACVTATSKQGLSRPASRPPGAAARRRRTARHRAPPRPAPHDRGAPAAPAAPLPEMRGHVRQSARDRGGVQIGRHGSRAAQDASACDMDMAQILDAGVVAGQHFGGRRVQQRGRFP